MNCTLTPAYGRDYRSAKDVKSAFNEGVDFNFLCFGHRDNGRYVNLTQLKLGTRVTLRYKRLTCATVVQVGPDGRAG